MDVRLAEFKPDLILEAGSGLSTVLLSKHARTVSLEHVPRFARLSQKRAPEAEVRLCEMKPFYTLAGRFHWYDTQLPAEIDFVLIDGPPMSIGREAALFAVWPYLSSRWEVWLDDADRPHEQACLALWAQWFRFKVEPVNGSMVRLTPRD